MRTAKSCSSAAVDTFFVSAIHRQKNCIAGFPTCDNFLCAAGNRSLFGTRAPIHYYLELLLSAQEIPAENCRKWVRKIIYYIGNPFCITMEFCRERRRVMKSRCDGLVGLQSRIKRFSTWLCCFFESWWKSKQYMMLSDVPGLFIYQRLVFTSGFLCVTAKVHKMSLQCNNCLKNVALYRL